MSQSEGIYLFHCRPSPIFFSKAYFSGRSFAHLFLVSSWLLLVLLFVSPVFAAKVQSKTVNCDGRKINYRLYAPSGDAPLPVVLLLHGAGDTPEPMIDAWRSLSEKEKIVLIAPELPRTLEFEATAPQVFRCVVEDAKHFENLDARRLYIFGNSMGGYLAYDALAFQSDYFAAVAVHAMGIAPEYDSILDHASRKLPVAIYIGDNDPLVSVKSVVRTRDLLLRRGYQVRYTELKNHDHNYYSVSAKVNQDVWQFFLGQPQP